MEPTDTAVERGSGNVFADLGFPDADAHLVKAGLVSRIDDIVRDRGLTQAQAARLMGLSQPDVSRLLRGDFREYSMERLFRLLNALGRDHRHRHPNAAFHRRRTAAHRRRRARLTPPDRAGRRCAAGPASIASLRSGPRESSRRPASRRRGHVPPA